MRAPARGRVRAEALCVERAVVRRSLLRVVHLPSVFRFVRAPFSAGRHLEGGPQASHVPYF